MLYFSELTNEKYETVEALEIAEAKKRDELAILEAKKAEKKKRAEEVEEALKRVTEAQENAKNLINAFCKDYGSFHTTYNNKSNNTLPLPSLLDWFFRF